MGAADAGGLWGSVAWNGLGAAYDDGWTALRHYKEVTEVLAQLIESAIHMMIQAKDQ